jgi:hypothetical protein
VVATINTYISNKNTLTNKAKSELFFVVLGFEKLAEWKKVCGFDKKIIIWLMPINGIELL